ncbi:hypothetical protein CMO93_04805 [Candidatus Woesearchaeota archaeon]|nr:hypothetical protein [Candidatus Woesearchaeota archaeon]
MIEFNPDGSIKLPDKILKQKRGNEFRMKNGLCVTIKKEVVNDRSPKKCILSVKLSEKFTDDSFVTKVYSQFMNASEVPSKLSKKDKGEFEVEVGTCFSRCKDCTKLVNNFREFLDGNVIEIQGSCSFKGQGRVFCYEDHFE